MDNKELIWVDKTLAEEYNNLNSDIEKAKLVNKIINERKVDITNDIQNLNDDLIRFKAFGLNYATEFKKAYDEQSEKIEKIWEDSMQPVEKITGQIYKIKNEIKGISKDIESISKELSSLNTYKIEKMIELIKTYNNMSDSDKEILKLILNRE